MLQNPDKIEVFLGNAEDMERFYQQEFGATKCYEFNQASSFTIHLFVNDANQSLIVLNQIDSEENLIHRLYQLHFAGITIGDIDIRGTFTVMVAKKINHFASQLLRHSQLPVIQSKTKLLIIGNTTGAMTALSHLSDPRDRNLDWKDLKTRFKTVHSPLFFVSKTFMFKTQTIFIAAVRMPSGKMAGDLTKTLLEMYNFDYLFMAGAGGAIRDPNSSSGVNIGDYVQFSKIKDSIGNVVVIPDSQHLRIAAQVSELPHCVVPSPLAETLRWKREVEGEFRSVDVESGHIVSAFNNYEDRNSRIIAGVNISDEVGGFKSNSLQGEISGNNAHQNLPQTIAKVMKVVLEDMAERHPQQQSAAVRIVFKSKRKSRVGKRTGSRASRGRNNLRVAQRWSSEVGNRGRGRGRGPGGSTFTPNPYAGSGAGAGASQG